MSGSITMSVVDWQSLMNSKKDLEEKLAASVTAIAAAEQRDPEGRVLLLLSALDAAREIVRFAVANLAPETVRGWPHEALRRFADLLETSPGASQDYKEMAIDLRDFANQTKRLEDARRSGSYYPTLTMPGTTTIPTAGVEMDSRQVTLQFGTSMANSDETGPR